ncbi:MAG: SDR family oxidoreductase [Candidatus Taylorbacteria bacterium]
MPLALVTGGNRGIGLACAEELIREYGYDVIILARDQKRLARAATTLGGNTEIITVDITDRCKLCEKVRNTMSRRRQAGAKTDLDVIIHAAGILRLNNSLDSVQECMRVNFIGTYNILHEVANFYMRPSGLNERNHKKGHIGIIGSAACLSTFPGNYGAYAASKAAVAAYCNYARKDSLINKGSTLTVAFPSIVDTDMTDTCEAREQRSYIAFPHHTAKSAAQVIVRDVLSGKRTSFITRNDRFMSFLARIAPELFEKLVERKVERACR